MPKRPLKPCKHRGCNALVPGGASYCQAHEKAGSNWKADAVRGNRHARGYGTAWDKIRRRILRRDSGLCQPCLQAGRVTPATAVDHVVSKARGGTDRDENLQAICRDCHAAKTARERLR